MSRATVARLQSQHPLPKNNRAANQAIGMSDRTLDACGIFIPYARCAEMFFHKLVKTGLPIWHDPDELEMMVDNGRLTLLTDPLPLPTLTRTPRILIADQEFLALTGGNLPTKLGTWRCTWTTLKDVNTPTMATCAPHKEAEQWLDNRARMIMTKFDTAVRQSSEIDKSTLFRWADIGIAAATDYDLRFGLYLRYCATLDMEKAKQKFETMIRGEFNCLWATFGKKVAGILDTIRSSPATE